MRMARDDVRIIQVSDLHLASEDGSIPSYQHFQALCSQHNVHVPYCLPGNHDDLKNMTTQLEGMPYCAAICLKNWLFIFLNTDREGFDDGCIGPEEDRRIRSLLAHHPEQYVALFMHHLRNRDRFLVWLRIYPTIQAFINGHIHQTFFTMQEGVAFYGGPSTCLQFVQVRDKAEVANLGPGHQELIFQADGKVVSQVIHLSSFLYGNLECPRLFELWLLHRSEILRMMSVSNDSQTGIQMHDWYGTFITMMENMPRAEIKAAQGIAT